MSGLAVHTLGSLNLVYAGPSSSYFVNDSSGDPEPNQTEEYVPLRSGAGARLAYSGEAETVHELHILCLGDTIDAAKAARTAIATELTNARNAGRAGSWLTYSMQEVGESAPETWKLLGGKVRPTTSLPGVGKIVALNGKRIAMAIVIVGLSKS